MTKTHLAYVVTALFSALICAGVVGGMSVVVAHTLGIGLGPRGLLLLFERVAGTVFPGVVALLSGASALPGRRRNTGRKGRRPRR